MFTRKGGAVMTHKIMLRPEEVKDFVAAAGKSAYDIDIYYNSYVVDAKSILGVLGLDLHKLLTVTINGYDPEFEKYIAKFVIAS